MGRHTSLLPGQRQSTREPRGKSSAHRLNPRMCPAGWLDAVADGPQEGLAHDLKLKLRAVCIPARLWPSSWTAGVAAHGVPETSVHSLVSVGATVAPVLDTYRCSEMTASVLITMLAKSLKVGQTRVRDTGGRGKRGVPGCRTGNLRRCLGVPLECSPFPPVFECFWVSLSLCILILGS